MPAMGYLGLVWETMGMLKETTYTEIPVVFEELNFFRVTPIPKDGEVELTVMIQKGNSHRFSLLPNKLCLLTSTQHTSYTTISSGGPPYPSLKCAI